MSNASWEHAGDRVHARRAATRSLHPDVGGDPETFTAALAAIDRRFGLPTSPVQGLPIGIRRTPRGLAQARLRTLKRACRRTRLNLPLTRRYFST